MICKCQFPDGVNVKPDGINSLDPCLYKRIEIHRNVNVFIDQCVKCGHVEITWEATDETESLVYDDLTDTDETVVQRSIWDDDGYNDFDNDAEDDDEWLDNPD